MSDHLEVFCQHFCFGVTHHLTKRAVDFEEASIYCGEGHTNGSIVKGTTEAFFTFSEGLLCSDAIANIFSQVRGTDLLPIFIPNAAIGNFVIILLAIGVAKFLHDGKLFTCQRPRPNLHCLCLFLWQMSKCFY